MKIPNFSPHSPSYLVQFFITSTSFSSFSNISINMLFPHDNMIDWDLAEGVIKVQRWSVSFKGFPHCFFIAFAVAARGFSSLRSSPLTPPLSAAFSTDRINYAAMHSLALLLDFLRTSSLSKNSRDRHSFTLSWKSDFAARKINSNLTSENDSSSTTTVGGDKQYFWGDRCGRYSTDLALKYIVPIRHRHQHCSNGYTLTMCCHGVYSWINPISGCAWHINQCGDDWTGVIRMPDAHGTTIQNEYTNWWVW